MYVCTHVITMVTGELVHPLKLAVLSLKKEGVVGGQEYYPEEVTQTMVHP